jgi:hypothetical protein
MVNGLLNIFQVTRKLKDTENSITEREIRISRTEAFLNKKKESLLAINQMTTQAYLEVRE